MPAEAGSVPKQPVGGVRPLIFRPFRAGAFSPIASPRGVAVFEWACTGRSDRSCQGLVPGPACTAGILSPARAGRRYMYQLYPLNTATPVPRDKASLSGGSRPRLAVCARRAPRTRVDPHLYPLSTSGEGGRRVSAGQGWASFPRAPPSRLGLSRLCGSGGLAPPQPRACGGRFIPLDSQDEKSKLNAPRVA